MSTTKPSCASLRNPEIRMFESAREENQTMGRPRLDPATTVATVIALGMVVVYVWIMRQQSDRPAAWFLTALLLGVAAAGYGTNRAAPRRGAALLLAALVLGCVGVLAILSIGFPILVAGSLCLFAAVRSARRSSATPSKAG